MVIVITLIIGLIIGALCVIALYEHEIAQLTSTLKDREQGSNERLTVHILSRRVRDLANAVNETLERDTKAYITEENLRKDFQRELSSLSHDIRTPLTGARGHLQLAVSDLQEQQSRTRQENQSNLGIQNAQESALRHVNLAMRRIDDTSTLLNSLFEYAKSSDPDAQFKRKVVSVLPLIVNILVKYEADFERLGFEPYVDFAEEDFTIVGDNAALARIFDNLISNALRYGDGMLSVAQRGSEIIVTNSVDSELAAKLDVAKLFERFYRVDPARTNSSSGLGLSVVKNLVTAMGIHIDASLEESTLSIILTTETK